MACCTLWQRSVLMKMISFILCFGSGYYFPYDLQLASFLILTGSVFFLCVIFICIYSFLVYQPPKTDNDGALPKRVRFSLLQQVHDHNEQNIADGSNERFTEEVQQSDGSNQGFLEGFQQSDRVTTVDNSNDASKSRDNMETENSILFTAVNEMYFPPEISRETKESEEEIGSNIPIREVVVKVRDELAECQNLIKQFQEKIRHERYKSVIDNVCFRRCLYSSEDNDSDDSNEGEIQETAL